MSPWTHSDDSSNLSCSHVSSHTGDVTTPDDPASNTDLNTISKPFASHEAIEPSSELSLFSSYAKAAHQKLKENGFSKVDQGASNLPKKRATYMPRSKKSKQAELPQNRFIQDGQTWEIQFKTCQNNRYGKNPRCTQCISKVSGDSCRFMGIRVFLVDSTTDLPTTNAANIFLMSTLRPGDKLQFPARDSFNRAMDDASCLQLKTTIATSLLPILEQELKHAQLDQALRRDKETTCRQMCEFCATSIFSASWLCRQCGKEYCPECYQAIASTDARQIQGKERIRKLTACTSRRIHGVSELVPLTRFPIETLTEEIKVMHELTAAANLTKIEQDGPSPVMVFEAGAEPANSSENTWEGLSTIRAGLIADAKVGKLHLRSFHAPDLTSDGMHREWRKGEPLLVTGVLGKMENAWDPQAFIQRYGQDECCITRYDIDTSTQSVELTKLTTVGEFFSTFGTSREERERILGEGSWKLKDWPPMEEFSVTFPELYEDFNRAVPAPDYTRRDGVLNLGSCYPKGVMQPDLGPKMYNAWPSDEGE